MKRLRTFFKEVVRISKKILRIILIGYLSACAFSLFATFTSNIGGEHKNVIIYAENSAEQKDIISFDGFKPEKIEFELPSWTKENHEEEWKPDWVQK